jgi:uncharacterized protein YraI
MIPIRPARLALLPALLLAACNLQSRPPAAPPAASPVFTAVSTYTPVPALPTLAPIASRTPTPGTYVAFHVTTWADNVNLRTKPGTLFPVSRLLAKGTRLLLFGRAPGGEWLYVQTSSNVIGWVLANLVEPEGDLAGVPFIKPQEVQVVTGRIVDLAGVPISGIGFAVSQGAGANPPRSDGATDADGIFYAYLPASAAGEWRVSYVSVACTSNTMDANCNCINFCGHPDPESVSITLPQGDQALSFVWR